MASNKSYITEAEIYNYLGGNYTMLSSAKAAAAAALATTKLDKGIMDSVHVVTYNERKTEYEEELKDLYERYEENCKFVNPHTGWNNVPFTHQLFYEADPEDVLCISNKITA